jgi:hypothetical protein
MPDIAKWAGGGKEPIRTDDTISMISSARRVEASQFRVAQTYTSLLFSFARRQRTNTSQDDLAYGWVHSQKNK